MTLIYCKHRRVGIQTGLAPDETKRSPHLGELKTITTRRRSSPYPILAFNLLTIIKTLSLLTSHETTAATR